MKLLSSLVLVSSLLAGCVTSTPGVVRTAHDNPMVTIGAGEATVSGLGQAWRVWYVIDRATETCWMKLGDSAGQMSCCDLRRVAAAREYLTWVNAASCQPAAATISTPATTPATPASSTPPQG